MISPAELPGKWLTLTRAAWYLCAALTAIVLLATVPVYYSHLVQPIRPDLYGLGPLNEPFEVLVGLSDLVSSFIGFALAVFLFWRKPNDRMALFASFFFLITALTGFYVLENFLTAYFGTPSTHELWTELQTPFWILLVCVFPDGRFVPRWTRWLFLVSMLTTSSIFAIPEWRAISNIGSYPLFLLGTYAQVYRYHRVSNEEQRKQTRWWLYGLFLGMVLSFIASLIYKKVSPPLLNVTPIFLTIAIVRSQLWDIDVILRRTVAYAVLSAVLLTCFLGSIILLQQVFAALTGSAQNELVTVLSTLAIAGLFLPLRNWIQAAIDKRFNRRKYDAQKVLEQFAATARDETDLGKLTGRLVEVVNETVQPSSASVWLKTASQTMAKDKR